VVKVVTEPSEFVDVIVSVVEGLSDGAGTLAASLGASVGLVITLVLAVSLTLVLVTSLVLGGSVLDSATEVVYSRMRVRPSVAVRSSASTHSF